MGRWVLWSVWVAWMGVAGELTCPAATSSSTVVDPVTAACICKAGWAGPQCQVGGWVGGLIARGGQGSFWGGSLTCIRRGFCLPVGVHGGQRVRSGQDHGRARSMRHHARAGPRGPRHLRDRHQGALGRRMMMMMMMIMMMIIIHHHDQVRVGWTRNDSSVIKLIMQSLPIRPAADGRPPNRPSTPACPDAPPGPYRPSGLLGLFGRRRERDVLGVACGWAGGRRVDVHVHGGAARQRVQRDAAARL
jgi:hypothetical protein